MLLAFSRKQVLQPDVTAVKLTGDANVPAGRGIDFRARVGPGDALDSSFSYPRSSIVVTRFKGRDAVPEGRS